MSAPTPSLAKTANAVSMSPGVACFHRHDDKACQFGGGLYSFEDGRIGGARGMPQQPDTRQLGHDVRQQLQLFWSGVVRGACESGGITAGMRKAGDQAVADRIGRLNEDNGTGGGRPLDGTKRVPRSKQEQIDLEAQVLGGEFGIAFIVSIGPAPLDDEILAFDIAQLAHALWKCGGNIGQGGARAAANMADPPDLAGLLPARRERPRGSGADERYERAPPHSITSSARPDTGSGTVIPSALAVLRLRNSSTLVDCWTGRSAGFSPFRILPT